MKTLHLKLKIFLLFIIVLMSALQSQAQNETSDDSKFKKSLELLFRYKYSGNYIDSTRNELRKEGISVLYQTEIQFPGAVENYIETIYDIGVFKAIFYRGNDYTTALKKYDELAATATRLKEESQGIVQERYCEGCSGIAFGTMWGQHFWVQTVKKTTGIYEVQLIYNMNLNNYYFKQTGKATTAVAAETKVAADFPVGTRVTVHGIPITDPNSSLFYSDAPTRDTGDVIEADLTKNANGTYAGCILTGKAGENYRTRKCFTENKVEKYLY